MRAFWFSMLNYGNNLKYYPKSDHPSLVYDAELLESIT